MSISAQIHTNLGKEMPVSGVADTTDEDRSKVKTRCRGSRLNAKGNPRAGSFLLIFWTGSGRVEVRGKPTAHRPASPPDHLPDSCIVHCALYSGLLSAGILRYKILEPLKGHPIQPKVKKMRVYMRQLTMAAHSVSLMIK